MTSSPPPPDLSTLSLGGPADADRMHYFATTAPGAGAQGHVAGGQYATLGASPLKNKQGARSGLPTVSARPACS
jgi:hypothetical protein